MAPHDSEPPVRGTRTLRGVPKHCYCAGKRTLTKQTACDSTGRRHRVRRGLRRSALFV